MKPWLKKVLVGVGATIGLVVVGGGTFVWTQVSGFDAAMAKVHDVPLPPVTASTDPAVIERGKHLVYSLTGCASADCHGTNLAGGNPISMGPVATMVGPNITPSGVMAVYSDGELARLVTTGVKRDGRSVLFMPVQDFGWIPDADVAAVVSYLRTVAPVQKVSVPSSVGVLGKVLDHNDKLVLNVARRLVGVPREVPPAPAPTAEYGRHVAKLCMGCHGESFSGGPIPGAPADMPIPSNITPDASGLKAWTYEDFTRLVDTGVKKNNERLNPFMPLPALAAMNETERKALWAYLQSLPPLAFGNR